MDYQKKLNKPRNKHNLKIFFIQFYSPQVKMDNSAARKPKSDMQSLPTRQYLDQTVAPILLQGLQTLAKGTQIE